MPSCEEHPLCLLPWLPFSLWVKSLLSTAESGIGAKDLYSVKPYKINIFEIFTAQDLHIINHVIGLSGQTLCDSVSSFCCN